MSVEYFSWSPLQRSELAEQLLGILSDLYKGFQDRVANETDDGEDRIATRVFRDEVSIRLRSWCEHFEVAPASIVGYEQVTHDWIGGQSWMVDFDFPTAVNGLLPRKADRSAAKFYRPKVLERVTAEVMTWLKTRPTYVDRVHPRTFEAIVAEILKDKGWEVELTKATRDGGYDVLAIRSSTLGVPISIIVECKLFDLRRPVGIGMVDRLMGVLLREESARAMLVTNSRFSRDAWKAWQSRVHRDLHMVDREELFDWLRAYRSENAET